MSGPSPSASNGLALRRLWRTFEIIGTLAVLGVTALTALGWRIQKPGDVLTNTEKVIAGVAARTAVLEASYSALRSDFQTVIRVQCLGMARREAQVAGVCEKYPTRDELARSPR